MKEFLTKIKDKLKGFIFFKKINPHIYWNNLLYMFFAMIIILILSSFYILYEIKNQQMFQITSSLEESPSLINEKLLNKVTESFERKLIKTKEIKNNLTSYKDPSI